MVKKSWWKKKKRCVNGEEEKQKLFFLRSKNERQILNLISDIMKQWYKNKNEKLIEK